MGDDARKDAIIARLRAEAEEQKAVETRAVQFVKEANARLGQLLKDQQESGGKDDGLLDRVLALEEAKADASLRAMRAEAAVTKQDSDWAKLMAEIAKLDPSWEPETGEPDPDDPQFREQYDPWHGLRLIRDAIKALKGKLDILVRESAGDAEDALAADYGGTGWERSPEVSAVRRARRDLMLLFADAMIQLRQAGAKRFDFAAAIPGHVKRELIEMLQEGTPVPGPVWMPQSKVLEEAKKLLGIGIDAPDEAVLGDLNTIVEARRRLHTFLIHRTNEYAGEDVEEVMEDAVIRVLLSQPDMKPGIGLGVVCFQGGRILLGKRHPDLDGGGQWELPGGSLKWGESWEEGARREVQEETGLPNLANFRLITAKEDYRPEDAKHNVIVFLSCNAQGKAKRLEPKKSQGWEWFKLDKLPEGPMFPALRELLTADRDLLYSQKG